ncbi:MAG: hypothetical protein ACREL5_00250 [Gemmatimonadales bacterium]
MGHFSKDVPINLDLITQELQNAKRLRPDGETSFDSFGLDEMKSVLDTAFVFRERLSELTRYDIITKAIFQTARTGDITGRRLTWALNSAERDHLAKPFQTFHVYTSLTTKRPHASRTSDVAGTRVSLLSSLPNRVYDVLAAWNTTVLPDKERALNEYQPVRIRLSSRTPFDAIDRATATLDYLRGVWNWEINHSILSRSGAESEPVNAIRPGPFLTVHDRFGRPAAGSHWFENAYVHPKQFDSLHGRWTGLTNAERKVRLALRHIRYADELRQFLGRYARALDYGDPEVALLKLWSLLEGLTGDVRGRSDAVVDRCAYVFEDQLYARMILKHIREQRNYHVHGAGTENYCDAYVWQLKRFVEALLPIHLGLGKHFASVSDACSFFDLPTSIEGLEKRMRLLRLAIRFRSKPNRPSTQPPGGDTG